MKTNNKKKRILVGVALIMVVSLVATSVFVYNQYLKEEPIEEEIPERVIDDQISPLENQGLIVEIQRIRHRGLYDKLMSLGNSWKDKPSFYYELTMDDLVAKSTDVVGEGGVFKCWDTIFQESKLSRDAEEEQEISTVIIKIIERVEVATGLFKLRKTTKDVEREQIELVYDYRTGRWYGDDEFRDYDGYGHYLGDTFEIWFNLYQNDFDKDYIPYWTEVNVLGTDPQRTDVGKDPDEDGIDTFWEWKWGYDPFTWDDHEKLDPDIDGVENIEEFQTARWFSDPYHQDVYCEVDHMGGTKGLSSSPHIFWEEGAQAIIEKYAEHNINLYFDMGWPDTPRNGGGDVLPVLTGFSQDSGKVLQFYEHNFPDERKGIFRYAIMNYGGPFNHPAKGNVYDVVSIGYNVNLEKLVKRLVMWRIPPTQRGTIITVASTMMHELGHTIGIHRWTIEGCDNVTYSQGKQAKAQYDKTWGQYWSVMNYYNMYRPTLLDYSDGSNGPPYDQNDWLKLFVAGFQYTSELVEEVFFEWSENNQIFYGETETGVTGYVYDEELTEEFIESMGDWSPVDPIQANWLVFKLENKDKYPDYRDIKILVQPKDVPYAGWAEYAEGELDSDEGNIQIYSQQNIIADIMLELI